MTHRTGFHDGRLGIGLKINGGGDGSGKPRYPLDVNGDIRLSGAIVDISGNPIQMMAQQRTFPNAITTVEKEDIGDGTVFGASNWETQEPDGTFVLTVTPYDIGLKSSAGGTLTGQTYSHSSTQGNNMHFEDAFEGTTNGWTGAGGNYNNSSPYEYTGSETTTNVDGTTALSGGWGQIDIGQNSLITSFSMTHVSYYTGRRPSNFYLLGSLDGTNWTTIEHVENASWSNHSATWTLAQTQGPFRYYRISVLNLSGSSDSRVMIGKLELFGALETESYGGTSVDLYRNSSVTIGDTSADITNKLFVNGNTKISGDLQLNGSLKDSTGADRIFSNWTVHSNGNDIYRTTGNVGIGTTIPAHLLSVCGTSYGFHCELQDSTGPRIHFGNDDATAIFMTMGSYDGHNIIDNFSNRELRFYQSGSQYWRFGVDSSKEARIYGSTNTTHIYHSTNEDWYIRSGKSAGKIILQDTGGNVGIGTNDPGTYKLKVNGTGYFSHIEIPGGDIQGQINTKQNNLTTNARLNANCIGDGNISNTELGYLNGVSSSIQTQIGGKQAAIGGAASSITSSNLTVSRALVSDTAGKVAVSAVTSTELGYLDGVTSSIQTQLSGKASTSSIHWSNSTGHLYYNGGNVGIGKSYPKERLDVGNGKICFQGGTFGGTCGLSYYYGTQNTERPIILFDTGGSTILRSTDNNSADGIKFQNFDGTERMFIRDDGNVGIGETNPGHRLEVGGYTHPDTPTMKVLGDALFGNDHVAVKIRFNGGYVQRNDHRFWGHNLGAGDTGSGLNAKAKKTVIAGKEYFNTNSTTSTSYLETGTSSTGYDGGSNSWWGGFTQYRVRAVVDTGSKGIILSNYDSESDRRIKHNIIDQSGALQKVLDIELKQYKYNNLGLTGDLVYGFIAQQVKEVYEPAIDYGEGCIHDINKYFDFDYDSSNNIIKLFIDDRDNSYNDIELMVETKHVEKDNSGNDYNNYTSTKKTYTIKNKTENYIEIDYTNKEKYPDRIFGAGHYVRDFHYIQKQRIFTLHHGAIQEIYKEQQADKARIADLETKNAALETKVTTLESTLETVLARLTELENTPTDEVVL